MDFYLCNGTGPLAVPAIGLGEGCKSGHTRALVVELEKALQEVQRADEKTDEETRRTTKKDLQGRRRANARGQQLTEREFPPQATARGRRTSCDTANRSDPTRW